MAGRLIENNVESFNNDVASNSGYLYTTNQKYSSVAANKRLSEAAFEAIETLRRTRPVATVLDAGCGDGTYTDELKRRFPELSVAGLDPAEKAIERSRMAYSGIDFLVGNVLDADGVPATQFDVVVFRGVLHHLSSAEMAISIAARYAKSLVIIEPNGFNPILKLIERFSTYHRQHEEQSFCPTTIKRWCREGGYRILSQSFVGFVPFFCPDFLAKSVCSLQPTLERIPLLARFFGACSVTLCVRDDGHRVPPR